MPEVKIEKTTLRQWKKKIKTLEPWILSRH